MVNINFIFEASLFSYAKSLILYWMTLVYVVHALKFRPNIIYSFQLKLVRTKTNI